MKTMRGISINKLFDYKSANIAATVLGLFYLLFPWFNTGVLDPTTAIFGLMFLTVAVMRAKSANCVISGLCQAFIGLSYLFAVAGIINVATLWMFSLVFAAIFFVMEFGLFKFGPTTTKADMFQIVPLTILAFALVTAFAGYGNLYTIDFNNTFEMLNYFGVMIFCFVMAFQLAGWNVTGNSKSTNNLILVMAILVIASALLGVYQGVLFAWR